MAIGFARLEFVKRSDMKNACHKSAYTSRSKIEFEGNCVMAARNYDFSKKEKPVHHEVLLPKGVDKKYKNLGTLWNEAERKEVRKNSQTALEIVLALPDDAIVTLEDRIELVKSMIQAELVDEGLAAQIDIHQPKREVEFTRSWKEQEVTAGERGEILEEAGKYYTIRLSTGKNKGRTLALSTDEFRGFVEKEHNWHAHVLIPTRRFDSKGRGLGEKARDLMPLIRKGRVVSGKDWGKLWSKAQNEYFQKKGYALNVDHNGIIPQEHLGPTRLRGRAFELLEEHNKREISNTEQARNPENVLKALTKHSSIFTATDLETFLRKHLKASEITEFKTKFWVLPSLVELMVTEGGEKTNKWTSKHVFEEERRILRVAEEIAACKSLRAKHTVPLLPFAKDLTPEQQKAFQGILRETNLSCIQGYAGTGKSYLLNALKEAYLSQKKNVRGLGPDSATVAVLRSKGLKGSENLHSFLFALKNGKREISKGKEVWIIDEAGKIGNRVLLEILRAAAKNNAKLILSGDTAQLPPVERGGMFSVFCKRFGSHELEDIQRQREQAQREISKNFATGKMGKALDQLTKVDGIKWTETKKEAIEALVTQWAKAKQEHPGQSLLMVAHKNDEVKVLNELARIVRKGRGELGEKEYSCETTSGRFFVSVNDLIEFRKNDKNLGVTNGLSGVLISASSRKFTVLVKQEGKRPQKISFDPQNYSSYQLGYASTYYRCQGRTVDRAYVLHSASMNKEMFYVGLTRHERDTMLFLSRGEVSSLPDLKRQAYRDGSKTTTLEYTSQSEIIQNKKALLGEQKIHELRNSEEISERLKGVGLSLWSELVGRGSHILTRKADQRINREFYRLDKTTAVKGNVKLVPDEIKLEEMANILSKKIGPTKINSPSGYKKEEKWNINMATNDQMKKERVESPFKHQIDRYLHSIKEAQQMKEITELEAASKNMPLSESPRFKEWQKFCGKRNELAYAVTQKIGDSSLKKMFSSKAVEIIQEQGKRHHALQDKFQNSKSVPYNQLLQDNFEKLLYRLFPDGPTQKARNAYRFGSKGALSVVHSGEKAGQFYNFETEEGGGALSLVQHALSLDKREAIEWTNNFLGIVESIQMPKAFEQGKRETIQKKTTWVSVTPEKEKQAPKFSELSHTKLPYYYKEVARHPYRDENGKLLYYVLRLQDKNDPSKKITPPLSYGHAVGCSNEKHWVLKGFQMPDERRTLYNLDKLNKSPEATVLIVEGEKTADHALEKFPKHNFITMTWSGGAGSVGKTDWTPLSGRKVLIWPDNDSAGYKAATQICSELKTLGVHSLHVIDEKLLQENFPKKWDLADALPDGTNQDVLQKALLSKRSKAINPELLIRELKLAGMQVDKSNVVDKIRINEILSKVDERRRDELEKNHQNDFRKIDQAIIVEAKQILISEKDLKKELISQHGAGESFVSRLLHQHMVFQAESGRKPTYYELDIMKKVVRQHNSFAHMSTTNAVVGKEAELCNNRAINNSCNKEMNVYSLESKDYQLENKEIIRRVEYGRERNHVREGPKQFIPQQEI